MDVFCAAELPFTEGGRQFYNEVIVPELSDIGVSVLCCSASYVRPLIPLIDHLPDDAARQVHCRAVERYAEERCRSLIRACDGVLAILDGIGPDSPVLAEMRLAVEHRKPIDAYWSDLRRSADNELEPANPEAVELIARSGGSIASSADELIHIYKVRVNACLRQARAERRAFRLSRQRVKAPA